MSLDQQLDAFRAAHPPVTLDAAGHAWSYVRAGDHGPAVLLLGGALGRAEFTFGVVDALKDRARVIAPDYPPARSLRALTDGLTALLDAEGIRRAHVVGGSFGGVVAQAFARAHPERVASLILSHTGAPGRAAGGDGPSARCTCSPPACCAPCSAAACAPRSRTPIRSGCCGSTRRLTDSPGTTC